MALLFPRRNQTNQPLTLNPLPMKSLFKKKQSQSATNFKSTRALEDRAKENAMDNLLLQRIGKSRQEIFDLMKILKTF
jgi:hypothetical protein